LRGYAIAKALAGSTRRGQTARNLRIVFGSVAVEIASFAKHFLLFFCGGRVHLHGAIVEFVARLFALREFLGKKPRPNEASQSKK